MSTKTSIKRIALVAVSALGFGLLSVVPAKAASTLGDVYFGTTGTTTSSTSTAVGSATTGAAATITVSHTSDATPSAVTLTPTVTQKPAGSNADVTDTYLNYTVSAGTNQTAAGQVHDGTTGAIEATSTATAATATVFSPVINFVPDKPGIYVLTFALTGAGVAGGARSLSAVLTIYAGYSADALRANKAFPIQGSNITTGWNGIAGGQASVRFTNFPTDSGLTYYVTTDTGAIISYADSDSTGGTATNDLAFGALTNGVNLSGGFSFTHDGSGQVADAFDVTVTDLGAATTTVSVKYFNATTGAATTFAAATVTWGSAAKVSAQYSLVKLMAGADSTNVTTSTTDTTSTSVSKAAGTQRFTIQVEINDQNNAALNGQTLTASISGPGLIGIADSRSATTATGRSLSQALTNDYGSVSVWGDGSAGEATITITAGNTTQGFVTLGTKTVTFVGSPAKATATQNLYIAKKSTTLGATPSTTDGTNDGSTFALTPAFTVNVTDADGNDVMAGSTVKMTSSDTTVITVGTCAENSTYSGNFECSVAGAVNATLGAKATVTFSVYNAATAAYDIVAEPLTFTIGTGTIATETMKLDAATYEPGAAMVLTLNAIDASGNPIADGTTSLLPSANKSVVGLPTAAKWYVNGERVYKTSLYAPATEGSFTLKATSGNLAEDTVTVSATVTGGATAAAAEAASDAAAEAIDAANAATDAANLAAEAADAATVAAEEARDAADAATAAVEELATQVATLMAALKAQITTLANTVAKIAKKVKA